MLKYMDLSLCSVDDLACLICCLEHRWHAKTGEQPVVCPSGLCSLTFSKPYLASRLVKLNPLPCYPFRLKTARHKPTESREKNMLSFVRPKDGTNKQYRTTAGRFMTRQLGLKGVFSDAKIDYIASEIATRVLNVETEFELVTGQDIVEAYRVSFGARSCMSEHHAHITEFYADNPDRFSLLKATACRRQGRALVVKTDQGITYMDRIYCNHASVIEDMKAYARSRGWPCYDGGNVPELSVSNLVYTNGKIPYMDTFEYAREDRGWLVISTSWDNDHHWYSTQNQDGYINEMDSDRYLCEDCDEWFNLKETDGHVSDLGTYCENCVADHIGTCDLCQDAERKNRLNWIENLRMDVCDDCMRDLNSCRECEGYFLDDDYDTEAGLCLECAEAAAEEEDAA